MSRIALLAVGGESVLVALAIVWQRWRGLTFSGGDHIVPDVVTGAVLALLLSGVNYYVIRLAPANRIVSQLRRIYAETLVPLFGQVSLVDLCVISIAAGVGEELLFRGTVQQEMGLVVASLLFGLLHVGGRGTLIFGCWAAVMGSVLGWVAIRTGGLVAPMTAHVVYDAAAIGYVRWAGYAGAGAIPGEAQRYASPLHHK